MDPEDDVAEGRPGNQEDAIAPDTPRQQEPDVVRDVVGTWARHGHGSTKQTMSPPPSVLTKCSCNPVVKEPEMAKIDFKQKYELDALWANFQEPGDFNPPHDHGGTLSWVIYLDVPEELKAENAKYKGRSAGPGGITFIYGDGPRESVTHHSFFPKSGDMYIFPAWLKHWVYPFKSDCTRISVSGNVRDYIKIKDVRGLKLVTKEEVMKNRSKKERCPHN